ASASYSTVIFVHAATTLTPSRGIAFAGTTNNGILLDNGSVTLTIRLTVANPSSRPLVFTSVAYKGWIEDLPAEAGLPNLGRTDNVFQNETGVHQFFRVFAGSPSIDPPVPLPPHDTGTVNLSFRITRSSDAARFAALQNITQYAAHVRGNGTAIPWIHWVSLVLTLTDVPTLTPTAGPYLVSLTRVVLEEGPNLG
ncbi:MAG: hypothetical protein L3J78_04265, partial [Thermoplasmata archaeon]|nr:hypothetical protein [Thermoplasmata archaeon]